MEKYLAHSEMIDWKHPEVFRKAKELSEGMENPVDIARACFLFVRDEIKHSYDYRMNPVTCKASSVLEHQTGYCYAKSHLLAALLRASGIPAGLCYQRLAIDGENPPFCLHGLNAVYLPDIGWYRVDARGNKPGVDADFTPPVEQLAFPIVYEGEANLEGIWSDPLKEVTDVLESSKDFQEVWDNLPDIEITE